MKNLILILVFGAFLSLCGTNGAYAQVENVEVSASVPDSPSTLQKVTGVFGDLWSNAKGGAINLVVGLVVGLFAKKGWTLVIKKIAQKGAIITKEIGETFIGGSNFFSVLDHSIKADGKLEENSMKELLKAGKEVIAEANDVIISIKPKV